MESSDLSTTNGSTAYSSSKLSMARPSQEHSIAPITGDPWLPIILALDGGGVRGLSSLYIIREIMKAIQSIDGSPTMPLPCNYLDLMVGTSTGGLLAIMLGRLRMPVDRCIEEYLKFSVKIFYPHRPFGGYSVQAFRQAVREVVKQQCGCYHDERRCSENHDLRQHDYAEWFDTRNQAVANRTCRVAVLTMRKVPADSDGGKGTTKPCLFRSYDHEPRRKGRPALNPRKLTEATLTIEDACRATAAAKWYFPKFYMRGRRYVDGAFAENNPGAEAYTEGIHLANEPGSEQTRVPNALVSIGTGKKPDLSKFDIISLGRAAFQRLTTPEAIQRGLEAALGPEVYWRFDVPATDELSRRMGLSSIKLDTCQREKRNENESSAGQWHNRLEDEEVRSIEANASDSRKGGYKPGKYRYTTLEELADRTLQYCRSGTPRDRIRRCAQMLHDYSEARRAVDDVRWQAFRTDPRLRQTT